MCEYDKDKYVFSVIKISSSSIFEYIIIMELVLGTSVYFSSSSEPSEKIFEPSQARAENSSSGFEGEQNRAIGAGRKISFLS